MFILAVIGEARSLRPVEDVKLWPAGPMRPGECLTNALRVSEERVGLDVVVGVASGVPHAWVADRDAAWELTWNEVGSAYAGLVLEGAQLTCVRRLVARAEARGRDS